MHMPQLAGEKQLVLFIIGIFLGTVPPPPQMRCKLPPFPQD